MFTVEIVWNREFSWTSYDSRDSIEEAISLAEALQNSGDGARVKKVRVLYDGKVVWQYGKRVAQVDVGGEG